MIVCEGFNVLINQSEIASTNSCLPVGDDVGCSLLYVVLVLSTP